MAATELTEGVRIAPTGRWSPAPAVRASVVLHGICAAALALEPEAWPQLLGAVAANHAVLACGMHPRSSMLGPNLVRLPGRGTRAVALTFDDGPDPELTPRVLDLLDAAGARATFFVIGERAARHAPLLREMLRRGHLVENHTHRHPALFAAWGPWRMRREIAEAQAAIADACGRMPRYFRAPAGLRSPLLDSVLALEGLSLVTWTRRGFDTASHRPDRVLARLTRGLGEGDILLLHDANARRDTRGHPVVLAVLPPLLDAIRAAGLRTVSLEGEVLASAAIPAGAAVPASPAPGARA